MKFYQLRHGPHMVSQTSLHRRRNAERLMYAAKVEKGHVEIHGGAQMLQHLAKSKTQPSETAKVCPHAQVGPLDMPCADMFGVQSPLRE